MINYNGEIQQTSPALSAKNRGFLYGDGVFDIVKYVEGSLFFWEEHYLRLMAGMRILRMNIPMSFSMEYLEEEILNLIKANGIETKPAKVRLSIFRKEGTSNEIDYLIETKVIENPFYVLNEEPYEVELFKDFFVQPDLLANVNHLNRNVNVLGRIFADENDYQNCILLNSNKSIAGVLNGNLFVVNGNTLKTPPLTDGALNGITRKMLIKTLGKTKDYEVVETSISPFELQKADELFFTNSIVGIQPIRQYRKKAYPCEVAKSLIGKLNTSARFGVS